MVKPQKNLATIMFISISLLVILLDQITKWLIITFKPQINLKLLVFHFVKNTGAGFGILKDQIKVLTFISLAVALIVILLYPQIPKQKIPQLLFALFLGGVGGNLIDRLFRKFVIDFIDFGFWPAFNLADMVISVSVVGLVLYFWKK